MRPPPLPSPLPLGPFRVREALALGVTESRLLQEDLDRPFHGLRCPTRVDGLHDRCAALMPVVRPGAFFSHATAAALWGLPLPLGVSDGDVHLASTVGGRRRRAGVAVHAQMAPIEGRFVHGLPLVEPTWAWVQCGDLLQLDDLVAMGDALAGRWSRDARARERPLAELDAAVEAWGGRRGAKRLREALDLVRPNVWSPKETELRLLILRSGLPEPPECNGEVTAADGAVLGHGDLVYGSERVVVEYEGDHHRTSRAQWRRDIARYESFQDAGWRVIRATDDDLVRPRILLSRLEKELRLRSHNI